ncbi:MAG: 16S rRNA (adenine(1518)-N(6)/adenine(1519)-N(6))-dimethyltransferase RsmA [Leptolinea sp.]
MSFQANDFRDLMRRHAIKPKKSLGQNFLLDPAILTQIVKSAEVTSETDVLEIGAGLGSLTCALSEVAKRVVAVELDTFLIPALTEVVGSNDKVQIITGDILEIPIEELHLEPGYFVVANIPYYITSAVIRHLLEASIKPTRMLLTIQNEVAERICATPGDMSLLALSVQVYGSPSICGRLPAEAFYPSPNVDSAIVRIDLFPEPLIPFDRINVFFRLIKAGFSQKRKMLRNSLSAGLHSSPENIAGLLTASGIDPMRRAETLSIPEWNCLIQNFIEK